MEYILSITISNFKQINYAADDALIGVKIFSKLIQNFIEANKKFSEKACIEFLTKALWQQAYFHCQSFIDAKFKDKPVHAKSKLKREKNLNKPKYSVR